MVVIDASNEAVTALVESGGDSSAAPFRDDDHRVVDRRFGRYLGIEELGRGGMGRVLRAYDPKLHREVALKVLRGEPDAGARARVLREAQALAKLAHPNVVAVHDVEEADGEVFIALEYVPGQNLREWLDAAPREIGEVLAVFRDVGRGLAAAHAAGLVHRDIKPGNVLVGDDGRVRVTDFGLARAPVRATASSGDSSSEDLPVADDALTRAGTILGTPSYMAPEQHEGGDVDARTDQYSFCVALCEALVGHPPFAGSSARELHAKKCAGVQQWPRNVPRWLTRVVGRGLAARPDDRWPSMEALLSALGADPTVRRRRWAIAGLAVAVVLTSLAARAWIRRGRESRCDAEADAIAAVWNDEARARVTVAFVATGSPIAEDSAGRVGRWLDDHAARWREVRSESCRAAELDGTRSVELDERARDCLRERREAVAGLVDLFVAADATVVTGAVLAAASLPSADGCADEDALRRRMRPLEPELRTEVDDTRVQLVRARATISAGRWNEGLAQVEAAFATAGALGWEPLIAEAGTLVGLAKTRVGRFDEAEQALEDAFVVAGRLGHDDAAIDAAQRLTYVVGVRLARTDEGLRWGRIARMLLDKSGQQEGIRAADVWNDIGTVHIARADWDPAAEAIQRARALFALALPADHPVHAKLLANLAAIESGRGHHELAVAHAREALAALERGLGHAHPDVATMYENLGVMVDAAGEDPTPELRRAIEIRERSLATDHPDIARPLTSLAISLAERGQTDEAARLLLRARTLVEAAYDAHHPELARVLIGEARLHALTDRLTDARREADAALAIYAAAYGTEHRDARIAQELVDELEGP